MSEYDGLGQAVEQVIAVAREAEESAGKIKNDVLTLNGESYVRADLKLLEKPDHGPKLLEVSTLRALRDYIVGDPDKKFTKGRTPFVLVQDPANVSYGMGADGPYLRRYWIAKATAPLPVLQWGTQIEVERFLINLRSLFVNNDDVKTIIALLARIDATNAVTLADDGVSQGITVNKGVRGAQGVTLPPVVNLQPFRTFSEVPEQPISPFILRLHGGDPTRGILPTVSLTEADMGQWKLAAVASIKEWLRGELPKETLILG